MLLRSAGLVTAASTLMLSFVNVNDHSSGLVRFSVLIIGLVLLYLFARSQIISVWMSRLISRLLKRYTDVATRDYEGLLHLAGEYAILEVKVRANSWLAGRRLADLRLPEEGVLVLGISRPDTTYLGAPTGDARIDEGDTLIIYGRASELAELAGRRVGERGAARRRAAVEAERETQLQEGHERPVPTKDRKLPTDRN